MTTAFARPFAEFVFDALARDAAIGTALLAARRHFLERGNPLGLAYTLYGSADFALAARTPTTPRKDDAS